MAFGGGDTLLGLVALVDAAGGKIDGRVRIQKEAFLLALAGAPNLDPSRFSYHYYGPFSRSVSDSLQHAVLFGLLEEAREEFGDDQTRFAYKLTDQGRSWLIERPEGRLNRFKDKVSNLQRNHWRVLELASTIAFLERREDIGGRDRAVEKALNLKPECAHYEARARKLLASLGL